MLNLNLSAIAVYFIIALTALSVFSEGASKDDARTIIVGDFSSLRPTMDQPEGWEPLIFGRIKRHSNYTLVYDDGMAVIKAVSQAGASGLIRKIQIDPTVFPIIEWRWKVSNIIKKSDVTKKRGDDYPARIFVNFAYDPSKLSFFEQAKYNAAKMMYGEYPPTGALNYIWVNQAALGSITPSQVTDRAMMIAVESGEEKVGQWVTYRRNLLADYRRAFGSEPPMISGIAIMTDTDGTGESATAFYGDIILKSSPQ
jgi:hypothetical protein